MESPMRMAGSDAWPSASGCSKPIEGAALEVGEPGTHMGCWHYRGCLHLLCHNSAQKQQC